MSTRAEIKDGALVVTVNLYKAFRAMPEEDKASFLDTLACDDGVIRLVSQQILDGWTDLCSHGGTQCTDLQDVSRTPLSAAVREVAKRSGEVAQKEIERLERALASVSKDRDAYLHEACELRRRFNYHGAIEGAPR